MIIIEALEDILMFIASIIAIVIEVLGLAMIVYTVYKGIKNYKEVDKFDFLSMSKDPTINRGLSTALEILLAGEIVKTITVVTITNLIVIVALVLIRLFMAFMLHWEGKHKCEEEKIVVKEVVKTEKKKGKK